MEKNGTNPEMTERELPRGLEHYEFFREFSADRNLTTVTHFTHRLDPVTEKPVLTPDLLPDCRLIRWDEFFGRPAPIVEIEIGSGKGGFLVDYARMHLDRCILGSEWDATWAVYAGERLQKHHLDHVKMLRGDVFYFLRDRVPSNSVDAFHMYFPDPWPKARQQKNRLMRANFLTEVARVLKPGARRFYWGTDHQEYNEVAQELFAVTPNLQVIQKNDASPTDGIRTNFEKKYLVEGRPIYRSVLEFTK
jgi:tRNA (guanine-N7-)-methyltransferase